MFMSYQLAPVSIIIFRYFRVNFNLNGLSLVSYLQVNLRPPLRVSRSVHSTYAERISDDVQCLRDEKEVRFYSFI